MASNMLAVMGQAVATFALAAALLVVLPGPDTLLVLRSIVLGGRGTAVRTVAGVLTGLTAWVGAAALGLSALLRASETAYTALRFVGAAYLVLLGINALRARAATPTRRSVLGVGYGAGLITNLLNPKIGVFFVTFLPGFIPDGSPVGLTSLLLGGVFVVEGALFFAVVILLAERVAAWLRRPTVRRRLDRMAGVVLIGFGIRLAVD